MLKTCSERIHKNLIKPHCVCIGNCKKHGMEHTDNWHEHVQPSMIETESLTLKWDCTIYTNNKLKHNQPGITLINKGTNEWTD